MTNTTDVIRIFGEDHVVTLTGLTKGQLSRWDRVGFFKPHYAYENRRAAYSRVYSFQDVVGLRTIAVLMKDYKVSLAKLRSAAADLVGRGYENWATLKLYVVKNEVYFRKPGSDYVEGVSSGQTAMLPVIDIINDVTEKARKLKIRSSQQFGQVEKHRFVARNSSVVAGTRIPTATIRRYRAAGYSFAQILKEYPTLTKADIKAALSHEEGLARIA